MAVTELYVADEISSRLSVEACQEVAFHLHKRDCQTCGSPLGDPAPALTVDDFGPFISATLHHHSCRPSAWYDPPSLPGSAHMSWTSRLFTLPSGNDGRPSRAMFIVCPHLEGVRLDQDGGDGWSVNTERHWRARGFRPMGDELIVDKWVADQPPPRARLTGSTLHINTGLEQWTSSADLETIKACRTLGGLLLGISTACEPTSTAGPAEILRYGAAGHIFCGWVPLTLTKLR